MQERAAASVNLQGLACTCSVTCVFTVVLMWSLVSERNLRGFPVCHMTKLKAWVNKVCPVMAELWEDERLLLSEQSEDEPTSTDDELARKVLSICMHSLADCAPLPTSLV